jgi:hypothetical protein
MLGLLRCSFALSMEAYLLQSNSSWGSAYEHALPILTSLTTQSARSMSNILSALSMVLGSSSMMHMQPMTATLDASPILSGAPA